MYAFFSHKKWWCSAGLVFAFSTVSQLLAADPAEFEVINYDSRSDGEIEMFGRLFVPRDYDSAQSYPLVIFYHGAGEQGRNNTDQVNGNINNLLAAAKDRDFFLLAPQTSGGWGIRPVGESLQIAGDVQNLYNIDPTRVYVTGLSLGGGATWRAISIYTGGLAAAVPIAAVSVGGVLDAGGLSGKPVWAYHGSADTVVRPGATRSAMNAIRAVSGLPRYLFPLQGNTGAPFYTDGSTYVDEYELRYSEYFGVGHNSWSRAYGEAVLYDWMLSKSHPGVFPILGDRILFDFGNRPKTAADTRGRLWNTSGFGFHDTLGTVFPFCRTSAGRATSLHLRVDTAFAGHVWVTHQVGSPSDDGIANDGWITPADATEASGVGVIKILGLAPGRTYRLEIFATHTNDDGGRGRSSRYRIGATTRDLEVAGNLSDLAVFETVEPDAGGTIELAVFPTPSTTSRFGQINTLEVVPLENPGGYGQWKIVNFTPAELGEPNIVDGGADPDADGVVNRLEYAFGLPPETPGQLSGLPQLDPDLLDPSIVRIRSSIVFEPDLDIKIQVSDDLSSVGWIDIARTAGGQNFTDLSGGNFTVTVGAEVPPVIVIGGAGSGAVPPRRFFRFSAGMTVP